MPINATFHGFIETTTDSLLIFEACRRGVLPKISRRLQERERGSIKSGTVFVFDEKESGIKRWTDGLIWSPSRILGNFLIYRELGGRESLNNDKCSSINLPIHSSNYYNKNNYVDNMNQYNNYNSRQNYTNGNTTNSQYEDYNAHSQQNSQNPSLLYQERVQEYVEEDYDELSIEDRNKERNLVGSLTDTYKFKKGGLIKKTLSIQLNGRTQHMISYYTKEDVLRCRLATPSSIPAVSNLQISPELLLKQSFRVPPSVEFSDITLKRPSLSPSSISSSTTSSSTPASNSIAKISSIGNSSPLYHPYHIPQHHQYKNDIQQSSQDHSQRTMTLLESLSPPVIPKKFEKKALDTSDNTWGTRRFSYHSLDINTTGSPPDINEISTKTNTVFNNNSNANNNFSSLCDKPYETPSLYQNYSEKTDSERGRIHRRHSNNCGNSNSYNSPVVYRRQNSCHISSSPPNSNNYQQRVHDIPPISHSFQQQDQQQSYTPSPPPPILPPSRFLWSANDDQSPNNKLSTPTRTSPSFTENKQHYSLSPLETTAASNYLPRCFEANNKMALSNNSLPYSNNNSPIIPDNKNMYFQQQQQQFKYSSNPIYHEKNNYHNNNHYE